MDKKKLVEGKVKKGNGMGIILMIFLVLMAVKVYFTLELTTVFKIAMGFVLILAVLMVFVILEPSERFRADTKILKVWGGKHNEEYKIADLDDIKFTAKEKGVKGKKKRYFLKLSFTHKGKKISLSTVKSFRGDEETVEKKLKKTDLAVLADFLEERVRKIKKKKQAGAKKTAQTAGEEKKPS
ncbi:MAG: hypothetical protein IJ806_05790 [Ruminococcus sp.]|nr:hypothetical protein [Ruminococcus sp.]